MRHDHLYSFTCFAGVMILVFTFVNLEGKCEDVIPGYLVSLQGSPPCVA